MKILWRGELNVPAVNTARNIESCKARCLPVIGVAVRPRLAIIGGSPSILGYVGELFNWPGDIWVSGSAFPWVQSVGICGTFFTIDQHPSLAIDGAGASKAILATCCDPDTFNALQCAEVEVFEAKGDENYATSVTAAAFIALKMGYTEVTFFGCDGSYRESTHAYRSPYWEADKTDMLRVSCNGHSFLTNPGFLMQSEFLSEIIRMSPQVFKFRGDGLLQAMIAAGDFDITHGMPERVNYVNQQLVEIA